MKKSFILALSLPFLLISCGQAGGRTDVSKATFLEHYKEPESCKRPRYAVAKYTYKIDETGMEVYGDTNQHESNKDQVKYTFHNDGTITSDHETTLYYTEKPAQLELNNSGILTAEDEQDQYGGFLSYEFYINPLRVKYYVFLVDSNESNYGTSLTLYDYTYNNEMWLTKFTFSVKLKAYAGDKVATRTLLATTNISYTF